MLSFSLKGQIASTIAVTPSPNPANLGQPVTLTATVTSGATGKVTFYDGTTVLGTSTLSGSQATFTTVLLPAGARSLHAHYFGDSSYAPSNSSIVSETVVAVVSLGLKAPMTFTPVGDPFTTIVADFNGDGKPDLVQRKRRFGWPSIWLGNGDGTFPVSGIRRRR